MDIKKLSVEYGLFLLVIVAVFALVFLMTIASRGTWNRGLEKQVESVFERTFSSDYIAVERVPIDNSFAISAAAYELVSGSEATPEQDNEPSLYGVIVRIASIYGFVPAVFKYDSTGSVEFVGIAGVDGKANKENLMLSNLRDSNQVKRWLLRIPRIVPVSGKDGGSAK